MNKSWGNGESKELGLGLHAYARRTCRVEQEGKEFKAVPNYSEPAASLGYVIVCLNNWFFLPFKEKMVLALPVGKKWKMAAPKGVPSPNQLLLVWQVWTLGLGRRGHIRMSKSEKNGGTVARWTVILQANLYHMNCIKHGREESFKTPA